MGSRASLVTQKPRPYAQSTPRPAAVDLFSGAGGFSLGFEQAGFDVVAALEYDAIHAATYSCAFPMTEVVCRDAARLDIADLRAAVGRGASRHGRSGDNVDVVFGGTPCQGFSTGGKREASDRRNLLVLEFKRLVLELDPRYFVMENVPAMRSFADPEQPDRPLLERLLEEFAEAGYDVLAPTVLNASAFGVPQDRRRLFLIGVQRSEPVPEVPNPTVSQRAKRGESEPTVGEGGSAAPLGPSVSDAIGELPDIDSFDELLLSDIVILDDRVVAKMDEEASGYVRRLQGLDDDAGDLSYPRAWDRTHLSASMRTRHSEKAIGRFRKTAPGESEPVSRYYRLTLNGLCSTLRAGTGYERGSFMAPRPIHPTAHRVISAREAARLHSFPDWFRPHATKWHAFRQIGNSLPPLMGRAIATELVRAMGVAPTRPRNALELGDEQLLSMGNRAAARAVRANLDESPSHKLRTRPARSLRVSERKQAS